MAKTLKDRLPMAQSLDIVDPETKEVETTIKVVGNESKYFTNHYMQRVREGKSLPASGTGQNVAELFEAGVWYAAAHIVEWDEEYFGQKFSMEAAVEVLSEPAATFIRDQIIAFVGNRESFFKKALTEPASV